MFIWIGQKKKSHLPLVCTCVCMCACAFGCRCLCVCVWLWQCVFITAPNSQATTTNASKIISVRIRSWKINNNINNNNKSSSSSSGNNNNNNDDQHSLARSHFTRRLTSSRLAVSYVVFCLSHLQFHTIRHRYVIVIELSSYRPSST